MNKQTAMQQLIEALELKVMAQHIPWVQKTLDDALEMERQQIVDAAMWMPKSFNTEFIPELGEQYYNETFIR